MPSRTIQVGFSPYTIHNACFSSGFEKKNNTVDWTKKILPEWYQKYYSFYKLTNSCGVQGEFLDDAAGEFHDTFTGVYMALNKPLPPTALVQPQHTYSLNRKVELVTVQLGEDTLNLALHVNGN